MALQYRASSELDWREGRTENISHSGILFRTEHLLEQRTEVEMSFILPLEVPGETPAVIVCRGYIVRKVRRSAAEGGQALAAKFSDYRFLRGGMVSEV
jgi:hypothetical protein